MKRIAAISLLLALLFCAAPAHAQHLGDVSLTTSAPATFAIACPLTSNTIVQNVGQVGHLISYTVTGGNTPVEVIMQGQYVTGGQTFNLSNPSISSGLVSSVVGYGYAPIMSIYVSCSGSETVTVNYIGSQSAPANLFGAADASLYDQPDVISGATASANASSLLIQAPYGSTLGELVFNYGATGSMPAGSTLTVTTGTLGHSLAVQTVAICSLVAVNATVQVCPVGPFAAQTAQVTYNSGGAGTASIFVEYVFQKPGTGYVVGNFYSHIAGTTATAVKAGPGTLVNLTVNTPAAGTITISDLATAACAGTPSTNTVAVITVTSTAPVATLPYDLVFQNGICIKASAVMDFTAGYQ